MEQGEHQNHEGNILANHPPEIVWSIVDAPLFEPTREREIGVCIIAGLLVVMSIFASAYTAIPIVVILACMFIYVSRREESTMTFRLTQKYLYAPKTRYTIADIEGYNIVDDPNEIAHLCFDIGGFAGTIVIPIFDEDLKRIEGVLRKADIEKDTTLRYGFVDSLVSIL